MSRRKVEIAVTLAVCYGAVLLAHRITDGYWTALASACLFAASLFVMEMTFRRWGRRKNPIAESA